MPNTFTLYRADLRKITGNLQKRHGFRMPLARH
jgi:hypothetical protein